MMISVPAIDDNQENFERWWNTKGEWIEEPNQRRGGTSGVLRIKGHDGQLLYMKRQQAHIYRDIWHPLGQATIIREHKAYCQYALLQVATPELVYCGVLGDRAVLVTKDLAGFMDLDQWLTQAKQHALPLDHIHAVLNAVANTVAMLHKGRLQHNSIYGKHVFVKLTNQAEQSIAEAALLDLEKTKRRLTVKAAALHDIPKLKRHSLLTQPQWQYFVSQYEHALGVSLPTLHY